MHYPSSSFYVVFLIPIAVAVVIFSFSNRFPGNHAALTSLVIIYIVLTIITPILLGIYYYKIPLDTSEFSSFLKLIAIGRVLDMLGTGWPLVIKKLWGEHK